MTTLAVGARSTVDAARRALARAFRDHGIDTPDLDARLLTAHALGLDHSGMAGASGRDLTREEADRIAAYGARRLNREPVARILARKEFWSLTLAITDVVLVPRPETETVVEAALTAVEAAGPRSRALRIVDIGTGSGALLLALLSELPNALGIGIDLDSSALALARDTAWRLGLLQRSAFVACDYGAAVAGAFDLIVSNPPYVARGEIAGLAPEVRDHDPHLALDGGIDGLDAYRAIAAGADRLLASNGHVCVEIGAGQVADVAALFTAAGLAIAQPAVHDLAGIPRALTARKNP
jgi:release factor glutamine methyltransferase